MFSGFFTIVFLYSKRLIGKNQSKDALSDGTWGVMAITETHRDPEATTSQLTPAPLLLRELE